MIKNSQKQNGSVLAVIIIIAVIALLGFLGYIAWNNFFAPKDEVVSVKKTTDVVDNVEEEVEYKTVKINDHNFRYPVNENNENVIIILDESTPALPISYVPIRNYYANKDLGDECKSYEAGLMNVNTEKETTEYSLLPRFYGKETFEEALADGTIVQVGDKGLYLHGPFKQNETCVDIYENKDQELQDILSEVSDIRIAWLKSLELVE